jgi:hypothetical protein
VREVPWARAAKAAREHDELTGRAAGENARFDGCPGRGDFGSGGRAPHDRAAVEAAAPPEVATTGNNAAATDLTLEKLCRAAAFLT